MTRAKTSLNRSLSMSAMVFYGLGTIIGAGIYVLIGEISGRAGFWTPLAFVLAALIAGFTGLSYAELVGRYPRSAGEAVYVEKAFGQRWLSQIVGWGVIFTGIVSASTLIKGFAGYYLNLLGGQVSVVIVLTIIGITFLACIGVKQSVGVAVTITLLELLGLLLVVLALTETLTQTATWQHWWQQSESIPVLGVINAAFLAFYAFIGFEDMVNMAEEVKEPRLNLPKAIVIAIILATSIYFVVAIVITVAVDSNELAKSAAPLTMVVSQSSWFPAPLLSMISLVAILNGAIVQFLMAPRVIYGITQQSKYFSWLAYVGAGAQTPITATIVVALLVMMFTLWFPLAQLAQITSGIVLGVFILVNSALINIKLRDSKIARQQNVQNFNGFQVSKWVPVVGLISSLLLLFAQLTIV
jgi:amino acid transporter